VKLYISVGIAAVARRSTSLRDWNGVWTVYSAVVGKVAWFLSIISVPATPSEDSRPKSRAVPHLTEASRH